MAINGVVDVLVGSLAAIGASGIVVGAAARTLVRQRVLRLGCVAMTVAGLLSMGAALAGFGTDDAVFGGLMMVLFGTGVAAPAFWKANASDRGGPAG